VRYTELTHVSVVFRLPSCPTHHDIGVDVVTDDTKNTADVSTHQILGRTRLEKTLRTIESWKRLEDPRHAHQQQLMQLNGELVNMAIVTRELLPNSTSPSVHQLLQQIQQGCAPVRWWLDEMDDELLNGEDAHVAASVRDYVNHLTEVVGGTVRRGHGDIRAPWETSSAHRYAIWIFTVSSSLSSLLLIALGTMSFHLTNSAWQRVQPMVSPRITFEASATATQLGTSALFWLCNWFMFCIICILLGKLVGALKTDLQPDLAEFKAVLERSSVLYRLSSRKKVEGAMRLMMRKAAGAVVKCSKVNIYQSLLVFWIRV